MKWSKDKDRERGEGRGRGEWEIKHVGVSFLWSKPVCGSGNYNQTGEVHTSEYMCKNTWHDVYNIFCY
jgi:hypothetical protein